MLPERAGMGSEVLVSYTLFPDVWPKEKAERFDIEWDDFLGRLTKAPTAIDKAHCQLISLCEYGGILSPGAKQPILRHAANVLRVFGAELDYDEEIMPIEEAAERLQQANIMAALYTSPSYTREKPRWRALFPFAEAATPDKRGEFLGRANRVLGGVASRESFTLSQSFYVGRVRGAEYVVLQSSGRCVDEASDLEPLYPPSYGSEAVRDTTTDADLRAAFDRGEDRYQAMLKLSSRWAARGMAADDIEQSLLDMLGNGSHNADGIDLKTRARPMAHSAVRKFGETRPAATEPIPAERIIPPEPDLPPDPKMPRRPPLAWDDLDGKTPPAREWIMPYWLPCGHITLLAGRGGIGKTLLAQHIGSALALGVDYIESLTEKRVLMWAGEDDESELWRRQVGISQHMQRPLSSLTERFYLHSYAGQDITLAATAFGALSRTKMLDELRDQVTDYRAELVILDNVARLFGGNENDRHAVTTFLAWLQGACKPAAILLLGHPAKSAGSEFSGSTAWEGAVRARLYLSDKPPDAEITDEDAPPDDSVRYLSRRKANYSQLELRRFSMGDGGVMIPEQPETQVRGKPSGEFAKDIVRRAMRTLASRDIYGASSTASPSYLPKLAGQYHLLETATIKNFAGTMRAMILAGDIASVEVGKYQNRSPKMGLKVVD